MSDADDNEDSLVGGYQCFKIIYSFHLQGTVIKEPERSSEMVSRFYQTTRHRIPEAHILNRV
jgi:hypothetical protein